MDILTEDNFKHINNLLDSTCVFVDDIRVNTTFILNKSKTYLNICNSIKLYSMCINIHNIDNIILYKYYNKNEYREDHTLNGYYLNYKNNILIYAYLYNFYTTGKEIFIYSYNLITKKHCSIKEYNSKFKTIITNNNSYRKYYSIKNNVLVKISIGNYACNIKLYYRNYNIFFIKINFCIKNIQKLDLLMNNKMNICLIFVLWFIYMSRILMFIRDLFICIIELVEAYLYVL